MEFLINIVGQNFWNLRLSMICLHMGAIVLLYLAIAKFSNAKCALIGVVVAMSLVMANPVYFPKDYHTLVEFFIYTSIFLIICVDDESAYSVNTLKYILLGLVLSAMFLTKQNIGAFYSLAVLIYFILTDLKNILFIQIVKRLIFFLLGYVVPFLCVFYFYGTEWLNIFKGNDSKGGAFTVLFRFLTEWEILRVEILAIIVILWYWALASIKFPNEVFLKKYLIYLIWLPICIIVFAIKWILILHVFSLAWPIARIYWSKIFGRKVTFKYIYVLLYSLAYCGTQTAGYNSVSLAPLAALFISELAYMAGGLVQSLDWRRYVFIIFLFVGIILTPKIISDNSYNWWGLKAESILANNHLTIKNPLLEGVYMDKFSANVFDSILATKQDLSNSDDIFASPSIPLTYMLLDKIPKINPVLWFDVTSSKDFASYAVYSNTVHPKYIYWLKVPDYVFNGHFKLRKRDPVMLDVENDLIEKVLSGKYRVVEAVVNDVNQYDGRSALDKVYIRIIGDRGQYSDFCESHKNGCVLTSDNEVEFKNSYLFANFIQNFKVLIDSQSYIFYVLKRID